MSTNGEGGNDATRSDENDDNKGSNNDNGDRVVIAAPATFDKETQEISDFIFLAEGGVSKPVLSGVTTKKPHPIPTHVSSAPTLPVQVGVSSSSSPNPTFAVVNAQEQSTPSSTSSTPTISRASSTSSTPTSSSSSSIDTPTPSTQKASIPPPKSKGTRRQGKAFDSFEGFVLTADPDTIRQGEEAAQRRRFERSKRLEEVVALVREGLEEAASKAESDSSSSSTTSASTSSSSSSSNLITCSTAQSRPSRHSKEDEFVRLLLLMEGDNSKLSNELFSFLFSLLLDNSIASKNSTTSTSRPLDFLYIFFKLLRKANYDNNLQVGLLKKLTAFVSKFTSVRVYAARNFWILHLLKFVISVENKPILGMWFLLLLLLLLPLLFPLLLLLLLLHSSI
jgi:hypothetical protein